jgi:phosphonate transport system permease protein
MERAMSALNQGELSDAGRRVLEHYRTLLRTRRVYTLGIGGLLLVVLAGALWYADSSNAGEFFDRLPYFFDFFTHFRPDDPFEIVRALFDLPSPYADGSFKYDYEVGRVYLIGSLYLPEYVYQMLVTINIALVATLTGSVFAFALCFLAASNVTAARPLRFAVRRVLEVLRAFPEIVIAGMLVAILSIGPIGAIVAVGIHTIGALGKLFYEVVENADTRADEGLRALGGSWIERVRFGYVPQVLPNFVSYFLLRTEINVRASTIIGAVGGGGIGEVFRLSIGRDHAAKTYAIVILLLLTIILIDWVSGYLRRRLVGDAAFRFGS